MNKYRSLETLLQTLAEPLAGGQLAIAGAWRNDEQSLGLVKPGEPGLSAYVFIHGQSPARYGVHLDYPVDGSLGAAVSSVEEISLKSLCELLVTHFDLSEIRI